MAPTNATAQRRRLGAGLAALVAASLLVVVPAPPAAASHDADDCPGFDTSPENPWPLTSGEVCAGSMNEQEPNYAGMFGTEYRDGYSYAATVDDGIHAEFQTDNVCISESSEEFFLSRTEHDDTDEAYVVSGQDGTRTITVRYNAGGFDGGCLDQSRLHYWNRVTIIPNTRPELTYHGPAVVTTEPLSENSFTTSATDVDGNLRRLGYRDEPGFWHAGRFIENIQWRSADEGETVTFSGKEFESDETVELFAEDQIFEDDTRRGARDEIEVPVDVVTPDCGTSGDGGTAVDINAAMPRFDCDRAWLWWAGDGDRSTPDDLDRYTVEVPADVRRVYARVRRLDGSIPKLTVSSPSGVVGSTDADFFFDSVIADNDDPGTWEVDVERVSGRGGPYSLRVWFVGDPAPPSATATWSPGSIHQGEKSRITVHPDDPNGQFTQIGEIDWGDGSTTTLCCSGGPWVDTGSSWTHSTDGKHRFWQYDTAPPVAVTLVNEEGLFATVPVGGPAVRLHDDCAAGVDAPERLSPDTALPIAHDASCAGTLGYGRPVASDVDDESDYFTFVLDEPAAVRVTASTADGLDARPYLYTSVGGFPFGPYLGGDTAEMPVATGRVYLRMFHIAGRGDYEFDVEVTPLL